MDDLPVDVPDMVKAAVAGAEAAGFEMSSDARTGALLRTLAASKPGGHLLEIGTGAGVGASWLLAGMDRSARLVTIEVDPANVEIAFGVLSQDRRCQIVVGDAAPWLASYDGPPFDLVFVDWRTGKFDDRRRLLDHLAPGGLYVGDDLLFHPTWPRWHAQRVERFVTEITAEPDLAVTLMNWATGLVVAARRAP